MWIAIKLKREPQRQLHRTRSENNSLGVIFSHISMPSSNHKCDEYDAEQVELQMEFKSPFHAASSSYNKFLIFMRET